MRNFSFRLWLEVVTIKGFKFVLPPRARESDILLIGDVEKVNASFSRDRGFFVGKGGEGGIGGRYEGFQNFLKKGIPIEAPEVSVWRGDISFTNGRHRFAVLRDMGLREMAFSVPREEEVTFRRKFGV